MRGGVADTWRLDEWVLERALSAIAEDALPGVQGGGAMLFLHLLGIDVAGHAFGPASPEYARNIRFVDDGVRRVVDAVEARYGAGRTTYVFTADHGMSDRGTHGGGDCEETETPFVVWGAGIARSGGDAGVGGNRERSAEQPAGAARSCAASRVEERLAQMQGRPEARVARIDVEQADLASLMARSVGRAGRLEFSRARAPRLACRVRCLACRSR